MQKFEQNGTSLNRNKGNSGRRRSGRSAENIGLVRNRLAEHPTGTSARRNGVGIPSATFNRITRLDLRQHPYCMHVRHELLPRHFQRRLNFAWWLTERCRRNENFLRNLVVGDEATFCMNGQKLTRETSEHMLQLETIQLSTTTTAEMDSLAWFVWKWTSNWSVFLRKKCKWY